MIGFNAGFIENAPDRQNSVVIFTGDFVPLELETMPELVKAPGLKSKLKISLSSGAASKLKSFTEKRVMKPVVIVCNGEALTMHKIREALTGSSFEITRCTDNACEKLEVSLRDNVK